MDVFDEIIESYESLFEKALRDSKIVKHLVLEKMTDAITSKVEIIEKANKVERKKLVHDILNILSKKQSKYFNEEEIMQIFVKKLERTYEMNVELLLREQRRIEERRQNYEKN